MLFRIFALFTCAMLSACAITAVGTLPGANIVEYRLSPGDKIKLEVFREEALSGEYVVNDQGNVSLPMVGEMRVEGQTLAKIRDKIGLIISDEYVRNAKININIINYRPIYICKSQIEMTPLR